MSGLPTPNTVLTSQTEKDCHVSYNPSFSDYGTDTTAIVLQHNIFLVLNGDHRKELKEKNERVKNKGVCWLLYWKYRKVKQKNGPLFYYWF